MEVDISREAALAARSTLRLLRPHDVLDAEKIRVGRPFDGGYVMIDKFDNVDGAYSFGINDDTSWDFDIAQRDIDVYQYDHTIAGLPEENPRFHWQPIGIAPTSSDEMRSIVDVVNAHGHQNANNLILKCDIECAEWETLLHTPRSTLRKFSQIVIELHDIYRVGNPDDHIIRQALVNLTNSHHVIHIHANNYGGMRVVGGIPLPNVVEVTLLRKDMGTFRPSVTNFPTPLDVPCNRSAADFFLGTFDFS